LKIKSSTAIILSHFLIAIIISGIISGCGENKSSGEKTDKIAIEDMTGRSVVIPQSEDIERIAVLTSPQVLAAYVVGVRDKLCGVTDSAKTCDLLTMYDPHLKKVSAVCSSTGQVDLETLLQAKPDIVIGSHAEMEDLEMSAELTTLRVNNPKEQTSISQIRDEIRFFGGVFGKEEKAEQYVVYLDNIMSLIKFSLTDIPADKRLKVFMGFNADHLSTYAGDTFMDDCIKAAGCVNAAGAADGTGEKEGELVAVSMEQVLSYDPDIVIMDSGSPDDLFNEPSWSKLKAVQNKRVYCLPKGLFIWNNASCESAVMVPQWLAVTAYPDKLNFLNMNDRVREFYAKNFNFQLTDNIIHNILYPSSDVK
jgi:iron complex transport system substrate-binding protein